MTGKVIIHRRHTSSRMTALQLEELTSNLAGNIGIRLTEKPLKDTICSHRMAGINGKYTLEHTLVDRAGLTHEDLEIANIPEQEKWELYARKEGTEYYGVVYTGQSCSIPKNKQRLSRLGMIPAFSTFSSTLARELANYAESHPDETEFVVEIPLLSLDELKKLPDFIQAFYKA